METNDNERRRSGSNPHAVSITTWNMGRKYGWTCICGKDNGDGSFKSAVAASADSVKHQLPTVPTKTVTITTWFTVVVPSDTDEQRVILNINDLQSNAEIMILNPLGAYVPLQGATVQEYETISVDGNEE